MKNPIIPSCQQFYNIPGEKVLDYQAICCFAATGFFLDNDTYYKNTKVLRAATELKDGQEVKYFEWFYNPRDISFPDAVEEFGTLFESITQELLKDKGRIILPLSGGLDSRTQAAALKGQSNVHAYSYKFAGSFDETKYGESIAAAMKWEFDKYIIPEGYLWDCIKQAASINECYSDFVNPRQMAIIDKFDQMGDTFYLGHWGDVLFDDMGISDNANIDEQIKVLYKKIVKKGGIDLAKALWSYWNIDGTFEEYFYERLKTLLIKINIENANARIRAFKSLYWAPRWTSVNLSFFSKHHPMALPYYDDRMCKFICTIPEEYLSGRQIQIEYIKRKAPELAKIPWLTFDPCNLYNYDQYSSPLYKAIRYATGGLRKLNEIISGKPCTIRNWEIQYLGKDNFEHLKSQIFSENSIAPREICEKYISQFERASHSQKVWLAHPLSMLLTLSQKCE